jgi:hypothetical protein
LVHTRAHPRQVDLGVEREQGRRVVDVLSSPGDGLEHDQILGLRHRCLHRAERGDRCGRDRLLLEVGPHERDVELNARRLVPEQQHEALAGELLGVPDPRHDLFLRERGDQRLDIDLVAANGGVDVTREPPYAARDHGDATDDHPRNPRRSQRGHQVTECLLKAAFTSRGHASLVSGSAPTARAP